MAPNPDLIRMPAVAGRFYPANQRALERDVAEFLAQPARDPVRAAGVMAPHAGYVYSGAVAGEVFAAIEVPKRVVVLCPNHTGRGARISVITDGAYRIPGRDVPIDQELADHIVREVDDAVRDRAAHEHEHAIEVELPFLVAREPEVAIVPVVLGGVSEAAALAMGAALGRAIAAVSGDVLVVASSDMSHFLEDREARAVDRIALEPMLAGDPSGLYRTVVNSDISMCGYIPATVMLSYASEIGARVPELLSYATSGDVSGDRGRVVGYAGVRIPR